MIEINNGKVFLNGVETINPELIGYAILDMAEVNNNVLFPEEILSIENIVYLKHDFEQKPRMITAVIESKNCKMYEIISGVEVSNHFEYELSTNKNIF